MGSSPVEQALRQEVALWAERGGLLFRQARHAASLNQKTLASVSGTSRTTLSAYEHGRKSPTLETAGRILDAAGFRLTLEAKVEFATRVTGDGRIFHVPSRLRRLPVAAALGVVRVRGRAHDLADRGERRAAYTALLCGGGPQELLDHVDGVLLVELFDELDLPPAIRAEWRPLVEAARQEAGVIN
ncbi:helix-turn-helix transcriptional regulator [Nonomuraea sp. KC401]|uniref:helix-turn-helix transcriptional regulator n=1 Tax=unclassified Nonomuraea TaxID=2593643 RepID=UPI0010FEE869|nr:MULTISPECIES: helix-turn-helix transcriptional regulator [unclassified Nonomuraea]NBE94516.1 helix-turn-helix domain-containing protein [Nonomuraea sp. K271]TLF59586.1 helix-turn-helix transcriptional regulator [Nonomuraea sp. KC401]